MHPLKQVVSSHLKFERNDIVILFMGLVEASLHYVHVIRVRSFRHPKDLPPLASIHLLFKVVHTEVEILHDILLAWTRSVIHNMVNILVPIIGSPWLISTVGISNIHKVVDTVVCSLVKPWTLVLDEFGASRWYIVYLLKPFLLGVDMGPAIELMVNFPGSLSVEVNRSFFVCLYAHVCRISAVLVGFRPGYCVFEVGVGDG